MSHYDVVWYWKRGWYRATAEAGIQETIDALNRAGYYALPGRLSIGPPDDAPTQDKVDALTDWRKQRDRINAERNDRATMTTIYGCMGL